MEQKKEIREKVNVILETPLLTSKKERGGKRKGSRAPPPRKGRRPPRLGADILQEGLEREEVPRNSS